MRQLLIILLLSSLLLPACRKAQVGETRTAGVPVPWTDTSARHPKNAAYLALLEKYKRKGLPGISLLVTDAGGTWVGATGKADIANNINMVPGTVSKAASITKLFIGTLVMRMMEDSAVTGIGFRALDRKISDWLPARITDKLPNGKLVTLGQCLKHETGIPDLIEEDKFYLAVINNPNKKWKGEELLAFIYDQSPDFAPGDTAVYSNTNTVLVTLVLEAQTGRPHAELLKQYITAPLGLTQTFYQPHDALPNSVAQGYYDLYNNGSIVNVSNLVTGSGNGYGGMYSNLFDLQRFARALMVQQTILQPATLQRMLTWGKQDGSNYYGYGVQKSYIRGADFGIGHKGRDLGYSANLFYFPGRQVMHIFFVNYGTDADSALEDVFFDFVEELVTLSLQ